MPSFNSGYRGFDPGAAGKPKVVTVDNFDPRKATYIEIIQLDESIKRMAAEERRRARLLVEEATKKRSQEAMQALEAQRAVAKRKQEVVKVATETRQKASQSAFTSASAAKSKLDATTKALEAARATKPSYKQPQVELVKEMSLRAMASKWDKYYGPWYSKNTWDRYFLNSALSKPDVQLAGDYMNLARLSPDAAESMATSNIGELIGVIMSTGGAQLINGLSVIPDQVLQTPAIQEALGQVVAISGSVNNLPGNITKAIEKGLLSIPVVGTINNVVSGVTSITNTLSKITNGIPVVSQVADVVNVVANMPSKVVNVVKDVGENVIDAVGDFFGSIF